MTALSPTVRIVLPSNRAHLVASRIAPARAALGDCVFCAHRCHVNRNRGEAGKCRAGSEARFFLSQTEAADEFELIPTFAVALSGCDLRCSFCITGLQSWNPSAGVRFDAREIAGRAERATARGARTLMILGGEPTIHLPSVLELISCLGFRSRLVWKTNGHGSAEAREFLAGLFDVWLVDYKFGNDTCASRLAAIENYNAIVRENLVWAHQHSELMVRHLLMPGHMDCCWEPVAHWLSANLPGVKVSLRSGFWPAWRARRMPELGRTTTSCEYSAAREIAVDYGLNLIS